MDEITAAGGVRSLPSREAVGAFVQRTQALDAWMVAQVCVFVLNVLACVLCVSSMVCRVLCVFVIEVPRVFDVPSREAIGAFVQRTQALDAWMVVCIFDSVML